MASTRYEITVRHGMRRASMPDHQRFIAEIGCDEWDGTRHCGCFIHKSALKTWGLDALATEIAQRLYDDYVKYYGESDA